MTYRVTYRTNGGALTEERVEAAGRAECLAALKARGIVPTAIKEDPRGGSSGSEKRFTPLLCLIGAGAAVLAVALWWLATREGNEPHPAEPGAEQAKPAAVPKVLRAPKAPEEAKPPKADKEPASAQPVPTAVDAPRPQKKPQSNAHLLVRDPNARVIPHREAPPRRFKYNSEEFIASLLEMEPGTPVIGEFKFSKRFLEDLRKSFDEKIEILDADDARTRELKEAVSATKEDLRKRMEAGEDVCQILKESRKQLQELAAYKMDLMAELRNIRKSGEWTAEEYSKFVSAANKMLEGRGATPIKLPRVIVRQLRKQQEKGDSK